METRKEQVRIKEGKINYACLMGDCPKSCCGPFGGVQNGLDSVNGTDFGEITLTPEDSNKLISAGLVHLIEMTNNDNYKMKLQKDGACIAFIDGKCSIHAVKPSICRAFPFYVDMFVGLCTVSGSCPGCGGEGWTDLKELSEEINASKAMYNFWLAKIEEKI